MAESGAHLTTSRINRLLRPLRNKCNSLAALAKPAAASRVTYVKQSSSWDPASSPPLTVYCRSVGTKKLTLDTCSARGFEVARRVYAVCDAFKNIIHVAYAQQCKERIPSLAVVCTWVIGENTSVEPEYTSDDTDEDGGTKSAILDGDGVCEAIPPHYRRSFIVSHALSVILDICTHHHTLITILLDHCLTFGLVHESVRLLKIIFRQAFLSSGKPPITHPAHTNYLFDLHTKWTTGNNTSSDSALSTSSTFCRMLLGTISQMSLCKSRGVWASKVFDNLLRAVKGCDIDSYIVLTCALSWSLKEMPSSSLDSTQDGAQFIALRDRLCELMSDLFDMLLTQHGPHPSTKIPWTISSIIDILHNCYAAQLHRSRIPSSAIGLPDIIISLATHIYVSFRKSIDHPDLLLAILDSSSPAPTSFSKLVVHFSQFQQSQNFGDSMEAFLSELKMYSSILLSEKIFALDASLWACALHRFETSISSSQHATSTHVTIFKRRLMEEVDAAERRCFGGDVKADSSPIVSSVRSKHSKSMHRRRPSGHWKWEDMVDSWIRMTPAHKKRKIDGGHSQVPSQHGHLPAQDPVTYDTASASIPVSTPSSTRHRGSSVFSPSSSSRSSDFEYRTEDGSEYQESDKENLSLNPARVIKASNSARRRSSNFFSLLADAQTNRIVLHPKRKPQYSVIPEKYPSALSSQESRHAPSKPEWGPNRRRMEHPPVPSENLLPSDDLLDLFAHSLSSPASR